LRKTNTRDRSDSDLYPTDPRQHLKLSLDAVDHVVMFERLTALSKGARLSA
jgi:hypothetical protein